MATEPLSRDELAAALTALEGWTLEDDTIVKTYTFKSYMEGLAFASAAGTIAEGRDHHPDIHIGWRKVTVRFTTHDAGNKVTYKDIDVARAIEELGIPKKG